MSLFFLYIEVNATCGMYLQGKCPGARYENIVVHLLLFSSIYAIICIVARELQKVRIQA